MIRGCITSVKFTMEATILRRASMNQQKESQAGYFKSFQDPDTGEIRQVWVAADIDPVLSGEEETIPCLVKANYTVANDNTLNYRGARLIDHEVVDMYFPSRYQIYTSDRVTNITQNGVLIYEDDRGQRHQAPKPTVYEVIGVSPITDPFGRAVEKIAQLRKVND